MSKGTIKFIQGSLKKAKEAGAKVSRGIGFDVSEKAHLALMKKY